MKKKIAILGSTGSIGKQTLEIIKRNKHNFEISLLTADKNHVLLSKQIKEFKVKNVIINNRNCYEKIKKKFKYINVYRDFKKIDKIITNKADYTMSAISGFEGLEPTLRVIKKTKVIAIANKSQLFVDGH